MTRTLTTQVVPEHRQTVETQRTCDLCKTATGRPLHLGEADWGAGRGDAQEVVVRALAGVRFNSEDTFLDGVSFDVCYRCFHAVLVPFLVSKGAEPRRESIAP